MKILFQGDSITDWYRNREDYHDLGKGYAKFAAENIKAKYPELEFEFIDLGISGNQTKDLVNRLEKDFIEIQPDICSILIGVNDVWHHAAERDWIPGELFRERYETVLKALKERTNAKIMMLEPFLVPAGEDKAFFRVDLDPKIQIVRELARKYADVYVPLDGLLAAAYLEAEPKEFAADSVHPTEKGARFIADIYTEAISKLIEKA